MIYLYYNSDNIGLDRFELWIQKSKEKYLSQNDEFFFDDEY